MGIGVGDYEAAKRFYTAALAPLGIASVLEVTPEQNRGHWASGFGRAGRPDFWIGSEGRTTPPAHIAFLAENRAQVVAFYDAAIAAGASDNGAPGLRPHYHPDYFAAFVIDADGHNIEAVCHRPE